MHQIEVKAQLVDIIATHQDRVIGYLEKQYLEDLVEKITPQSDMGLIKTHIINLIDAIRNEPELREDLMQLCYNITEVTVDDKKELIGEIIELQNNIKLNYLVTNLIYDFFNHSLEIGLNLDYRKGKFIAIAFASSDESNTDETIKRVLIPSIDLYIYDNTTDLLTKLLSIVGQDNCWEN